MKTRPIHSIVPILTMLAAAALLSGCGTTSAYKQAEKTGAGIASFRAEVVNANKTIDATMRSLDDIAATANTNPRGAFARFSKNVKNLESTAAKMGKRSLSMQQKGQAYFRQWEQELATVNNPEVRRLAEQRKAKLQETFATIRKYTEPLKAQFDPWMSDLKDLQKYLSQDLTIAGIDSAKALFAKTTSEGVEVQKSMDALVAELNTVAAALTPAKVQGM